MIELMKPQDVRRILKCSLSTVYLLVDRRMLAAVRWPSPANPGKRPKSCVRFDPADVQAFIKRHKTI